MIGIKVCGLTRPQDACAAVAAGANAVGVIFARSPRRVTLAQARAVFAGLPPQIVRFGVFADQPRDRVKRLAKALALDRLQFHGHESENYLSAFPQGRVVRALRPAVSERPHGDPSPAASAWLVDAASADRLGGTGLRSNWAYARALKRWGKPVILSGGLNARNVAQAIRAVRPAMVDVCSGVELAPGRKSAAKLRALIRAVRACE